MFHIRFLQESPHKYVLSKIFCRENTRGRPKSGIVQNRGSSNPVSKIFSKIFRKRTQERAQNRCSPKILCLIHSLKYFVREHRRPPKIGGRLKSALVQNRRSSNHAFHMFSKIFCKRTQEATQNRRRRKIGGHTKSAVTQNRRSHKIGGRIIMHSICSL